MKDEMGVRATVHNVDKKTGRGEKWIQHAEIKYEQYKRYCQAKTDTKSEKLCKFFTTFR